MNFFSLFIEHRNIIPTRHLSLKNGFDADTAPGLKQAINYKIQEKLKTSLKLILSKQDYETDAYLEGLKPPHSSGYWINSNFFQVSYPNANSERNSTHGGHVPTSNPTNKDKKCLFLENDEFIIKYFRMNIFNSNLSPYGEGVDFAHSFDQAIMKSKSEKYHLIISDIHLGNTGLNGLDFLNSVENTAHKLLVSHLAEYFLNESAVCIEARKLGIPIITKLRLIESNNPWSILFELLPGLKC